MFNWFFKGSVIVYSVLMILIFSMSLSELTKENIWGGIVLVGVSVFVLIITVISALGATNDKLSDPPIVVIDKPGKLSDGYHTFDELYGHRNFLFVTVLKSYPDAAWKAKKHYDGTIYGGYFIAGLSTPYGDITYHLPNELWDVLEPIVTLDRAHEWDGYTSDDVLKRLRRFSEELNK